MIKTAAHEKITDEQFMKAYYELDNKTTQNLQEILTISAQTVRAKSKKLGLKLERLILYHDLSNLISREDLEIMLKNISYYRIAYMYGVSPAGISDLAKKYGLKSKHIKINNIPNPISKEEILDGLKNGLTLSAIGKKYNISTTSLNTKMKKYDIKWATPRKAGKIKQVETRKGIIKLMERQIKNKEEQLLQIQKKISNLYKMRWYTGIDARIGDLMFQKDNVLEEIQDFKNNIESYKKQIDLIYNGLNVYKRKINKVYKNGSWKEDNKKRGMLHMQQPKESLEIK